MNRKIRVAKLDNDWTAGCPNCGHLGTATTQPAAYTFATTHKCGNWIGPKRYPPTITVEAVAGGESIYANDERRYNQWASPRLVVW